MTYAEFFYEIKNKFMGTDVSDIKEHLAFQFNIEDEEAGGIFYVEVKDGQLFVEPYEYYDRDAMFIADPDTFTKIAEGKVDPVWAFTVQKLRVEGNIDKALRLKEIIELKQKQKKAEEARKNKEAKKAEEAQNKEAKKAEETQNKEAKKVEEAKVSKTAKNSEGTKKDKAAKKAVSTKAVSSKAAAKKTGK